jgi:hypothetical protein
MGSGGRTPAATPSRVAARLPIHQSLMSSGLSNPFSTNGSCLQLHHESEKATVGSSVGFGAAAKYPAGSQRADAAFVLDSADAAFGGSRA